MSKLVIVESPTKARTIRGYLPDGYHVEASMGHIRDLPASASEIPAAYKGESWSRLGVNVEQDFDPLYVVPSDKKKVVTALKKELKKADELILATDEDREGESIGWHLTEVLKPKVPVQRMVFHEITQEAILRGAAADTRDRRGLGAGAGDAAHPGPAGGLYGVAAAVEEGGAKAVGRPRAERGGAAAGGAGAAAPSVPCGRVLGFEGAFEQAAGPSRRIGLKRNCTRWAACAWRAGVILTSPQARSPKARTSCC